MTYEELLAKVNEELATIYEDASGNFPVGLSALRSVMELHKPGKNDDDELGCRECSKLMLDGSRVLTYRYPCPTIQAIEKELVNG